MWPGLVALLLFQFVLLFAAARSIAAPLPLAIQAQNSQAISQPDPPRAPSQNILSPAARERAIRYSHTEYAIYFGGVALDLAIYAALWLSGFGVWLRSLAMKASRRLFVQCLIFVPILWLAASGIGFPVDYYGGYVVEHRFGLSTQSFASWLGDWSKMLVLTLIAAVILVWILYRMIRWSPRRCWLWFWLATVPLALFVAFGEPYVIAPLFYKFTPLAQTQPALTARIEGMLHHAGVDIPESRIYEMNASSKTRAVDAYVTGIGRSTRVVVWDTTLKKMTPDEVLIVVGHETGHYVLHHVLKEFVLEEMVAFAGFWIGFVIVVWAIRRWGRETRIEGMSDLAGFPLLMLIVTAIVFLISPMDNGISRYYEHQADQYGLELSHGIVPSPNAAMVRSFEILGKDDLDDPAPNPFIKFWLFTHPPLDERIRFAEHYRPWAEDKPMKLLKKSDK